MASPTTTALGYAHGDNAGAIMMMASVTSSMLGQPSASPSPTNILDSPDLDAENCRLLGPCECREGAEQAYINAFNILSWKQLYRYDGKGRYAVLRAYEQAVVEPAIPNIWQTTSNAWKAPCKS